MRKWIYEKLVKIGLQELVTIVFILEQESTLLISDIML